MTNRYLVLTLDDAYLNRAAKVRQLPRTRLVQMVMERVIKDELVLSILKDDDQPYPKRPPPRRQVIIR
jgi:hypothetical protein